MTEELFREDAYLKSCEATVTGVDDDGVSLDRTVCYPLGGGQPGDTGTMRWGSESAAIVDTRYGAGGIRHVLEDGAPIPEVGQQVEVEIDWDRRM